MSDQHVLYYLLAKVKEAIESKGQVNPVSPGSKSKIYNNNQLLSLLACQSWSRSRSAFQNEKSWFCDYQLPPLPEYKCIIYRLRQWWRGRHEEKWSAIQSIVYLRDRISMCEMKKKKILRGRWTSSFCTGVSLPLSEYQPLPLEQSTCYRIQG